MDICDMPSGKTSQKLAVYSLFGGSIYNPAFVRV